MICIDHLKKQYKETQALKGVSLRVTVGELYAYLGPNGAGKTTTIRILTGLTRSSSGRVRLNGADPESGSPDARRQCGLVPQFANLDPELTVAENLDIHGRLYAMGALKRRERIAELLAYVEMEPRGRALVKTLSGGMKRRVMIARALLHAPRILFMDEPTVGLDAAVRRKIWALIKKIQSEGTTIFLTTHYMEEAEFLADRVAFIDEGRIMAEDTPGALMQRMGAWALDSFGNNGMETRYFESRHEARGYVTGHSSEFTLRRVNLEDAFLNFTGKRVNP